jgi:epoxyqueuosine reductase
LTSDTVKRLAQECGFDLAGIAAAEPPDDFERYRIWVDQGHAGAMGYLADRRAEVRRDVRRLLPSAKTVICVGKLYQQSTAPTPEGHGIVSRYAWGEDYHRTMHANLEQLAARLEEIEACEWKVCVDTAPVLERTYARLAGLGWVGKNTCLINEGRGSWFFLGELITSLELHADIPPSERCGTCTRCIEACPTDAIRPAGDWWSIDARRCIAYLTIELHGSIPDEHREAMGAHVFGCDICQDVCPWNSRGDSAPAASRPAPPALDLIECSNLSEQDFHLKFRDSPLARPKHAGFLRNIAIAMGNSGSERFIPPLERLAAGDDAMVAEHAQWALGRVKRCEE